MEDRDALFMKRRVKFEHLLPFGFIERKNTYTYSVRLVNGQFEMTVLITKDGKVSTEVIDEFSKEHYVLHRVSSANGAFVNTVREEYEEVLTAIVDACFESDVFKSDGARQVIQYVREKYQDEPQFLWERFPENAIFRRKDNKKWYAALLVLRKNKLGFNEDGMVDIIDLKGNPEDIGVLVDGGKYLPGYHMNKKYWFTICLDCSVPSDEIFRRIDESFALAAK